ncbi:sulfotransferase family 2 domain-containing protein [Croceicoccus bisphenolivorans]|uniref:sulfotransferase family 2 domain-containing protein n=1 Tax=Croceicoccus bisphenolivorans TaxID=1783232 RepID=UPI000836040D|nr:sulfotransferase family 2 domain-containing protein [Croceicoccus bisphenolivorans]
MLTAADRIRLRVKDMEFRHGLPMQRLALRTGVLSYPYLPEDERLEAVFIHVPKAAGTSLRKAIWRRKSFHIPATRYIAADPDRFRRWFTFCVVRNPWDRMSSAFHYLHRRRTARPDFFDHRWAATRLADVETFAAFLHRLDGDERFRSDVMRYVHFRSQLTWISQPGARDRILVDYVGRFERMDQAYAYVSNRLAPGTPLPQERVRGDGKDYRQLYDTRMVDIVAGLYRQDVEVLGYSFE